MKAQAIISDEATGPDMPIAEAREWLQDMRRSDEDYPKADVERKLGDAEKHASGSPRSDVSLHSLDLLTV